MLELKFSLTKSFTIGKGGDVLIIGTDTGLRMCKEISIFPRKGYFRVSEDQWLTCREISSECSRGVSRGRPDLIPGIVEQAFNIERIEFINVVIDELDTVFAIGIAIAKSFPMFSAKEGYDRFDRFANQQINVRFLCFDRNVAQKQIDLLNYCYSSIRNTARIVDTPACDMNVSHMIQEARLVVEKLNEISDNGKIEIEVINGIDLLTQGFGGIYAVGKGAQESPALVQLSFKPANTPKDVIALIGKGVGE
jgi:leucyl aminopeptidase